MYRVCTGVSFSIKDIYMYRLFVFSLSFPLGMYRVCTGVSFSVKDIYVQTLCFLSVLPFRYVQSVHWSFLFCKIYMYRLFVFSLSFPLGMCRVCTGVVHWNRMPVSWLRCINRTSQCGASAVRCLTWPSNRFAGSMFSLCHRVRLEIHFFDSFDCCCFNKNVLFNTWFWSVNLKAASCVIDPDFRVKKWVQLVPDGIYVLRKAHIYALHPVSQKLLHCCHWSGSNVHVTDNGPLSSFQGRLSSMSLFNASLLQAIEGVMSLGLCPHAVSQAPQHFRSSEKQAACKEMNCGKLEKCFWCISFHSWTDWMD